MGITEETRQREQLVKAGLQELLLTEADRSPFFFVGPPAQHSRVPSTGIHHFETKRDKEENRTFLAWFAKI